MSVTSDQRVEFLLKMYEAAWQNITRTDNQLWNVFISYAAVVVGTAVLSDKVLNAPFLGVLVSLLLTAVAMSFSFNVNLWFLRNIVIIANLEATFLTASDYDVIIPKQWKPPYPGWFLNLKEFPSILGFVYPAVGAIIVINSWSQLEDQEKHLVLAFLIILFLLTAVYIGYLAYRFEKLKKGAPGPK